jgi:hypothetical protein
MLSLGNDEKDWAPMGPSNASPQNMMLSEIILNAEEN